jgi:hypothetical protein
MTRPKTPMTLRLKPQDCRTLGIFRGIQWYIEHRGAGSTEQVAARAEIAEELPISDLPAFCEGWQEGVRLLEPQPWYPCFLCDMQRPRMALHLVGESYLCLSCYHDQELIEQHISEHEARHS